MKIDDITNFYCKRQCDGYLELRHQDEPNKPCETQCLDCACEVGERRIKTKSFNQQK